MAKINIPVQLYKGRDAIPLKKMGKIVQETEKFLNMLGEDIQLESEEGEWLATNIKGGSLGFNIERSGVSDNKRHVFMHNFEQIVKDPLGKENGHISRKTRKQFANIADSLDPGDYISFGLPAKNRKKPVLHHLSKETSLEIIKSVDKQVEYYASIQGIIHELQLETHPLSFKIRELSTGRLIKCFYNDDLYDNVRETLKRKNCVVYIAGLITANLFDEKIEFVKVEKKEDIRTGEEFRREDIDNFIGCCPGMLKDDESLQDWINEVRERG